MFQTVRDILYTYVVGMEYQIYKVAFHDLEIQNLLSISKIYFAHYMALKLLKVLFCMRVSKLYAEINGSIFVYQFMVLSSIVSVKSFSNTMQHNTNILKKKLKLFILIKVLTNTTYKELEVNPTPLQQKQYSLLPCN